MIAYLFLRFQNAKFQTPALPGLESLAATPAYDVSKTIAEIGAIAYTVCKPGKAQKLSTASISQAGIYDTQRNHQRPIGQATF